MADESTSPPSPRAPSPLAADDIAEARLAPGGIVPLAGTSPPRRRPSEPSIHHTACFGAGDRPRAARCGGRRPGANPLGEGQDGGLERQLQRRQGGRPRVHQQQQQRPGQPKRRVLRRHRLHVRREARVLVAAAEPRHAGVHVPGAGARDGRVQRGQRAGPGRVRRGLPRPARRRHPGRHQAAAAGPPAPGRTRVPHRGRPVEQDALAVPAGSAGLLRRPEPPAAGLRVHAQRQPQEPPPPAAAARCRRWLRRPGGAEVAATPAAAAGLADPAEHRAGLRPRAGVPARAQLPRRDPPRLQVQQHPPRPQLPRPRLRLRHGQDRLQQGQRPGRHPRPRHHRLPRPRVRVDGQADDQVGRVQLRGGASRAADRSGAGRHAATARTARPGVMGASTAYRPREARADGGPGPERPVRHERSNSGCRHRRDVHTDQGRVPAADDGRGAVPDPHREEPRHVLLLHAAEARAACHLREPAAGKQHGQQMMAWVINGFSTAYISSELERSTVVCPSCPELAC